MRRDKEGLVLLSGGLDSVVCLHYAARECSKVHAMFVRHGQPSEAQEEYCVRYQCNKLGTTLKVVQLHLEGIPYLEHHTEDASELEKNAIPFRNGVLLALAGNYCEAHNIPRIYFGSHMGTPAQEARGETFPDSTFQFVYMAEYYIRMGTRKGFNPFLIQPLAYQTKAGVFAEAHRLGVDITKTWSCYTPTPRFGRTGDELPLPCGECSACRRNKEAFEDHKE